MAAHHFTASYFRNHQAQLFDLADKGEQIIINRGKKRAYALVPVDKDDIRKSCHAVSGLALTLQSENLEK